MPAVIAATDAAFGGNAVFQRRVAVRAVPVHQPIAALVCRGTARDPRRIGGSEAARPRPGTSWRRGARTGACIRRMVCRARPVRAPRQTPCSDPGGNRCIADWSPRHGPPSCYGMVARPALTSAGLAPWISAFLIVFARDVNIEGPAHRGARQHRFLVTVKIRDSSRSGAGRSRATWPACRTGSRARSAVRQRNRDRP